MKQGLGWNVTCCALAWSWAADSYWPSLNWNKLKSSALAFASQSRRLIAFFVLCPGIGTSYAKALRTSPPSHFRLNKKKKEAVKRRTEKPWLPVYRYACNYTISFIIPLTWFCLICMYVGWFWLCIILEITPKSPLNFLTVNRGLIQF